MKLIVKTIILLVSYVCSFLFILIFWILYYTSKTIPQVHGEKVLQCSKYGCENIIGYGVPSLFFLLAFVFHILYHFHLFGGTVDYIIKICLKLVSLAYITKLFFYVIPKLIYHSIKGCFNKDGGDGGDDAHEE